MSFTNKVVLVTGASSGIGASIAIHFAIEGACVAIIGRNEIKLNNTANECQKHSKKTLIIIADVTKDDEVENALKKTIEEFGRLDILINNAGFKVPGSILEANIVNAYDKVMKVNIRAAIKLSTLAAPFLVESKGNIINISSVSATHVPVGAEYISYGISKAALSFFSRAAAAELATVGVRVNSISPGPVFTDFLENAGSSDTWVDLKEKTALNRVSDPKEVADLVLYLASDKCKGITGSTFVCDNGWKLKY